MKAKTLDVEVYDPEFFIDFGFAEKDPVRLVTRRHNAQSLSRNRTTIISPAALRLDKSFMTSEANAGMGASFANRISVKCP